MPYRLEYDNNQYYKIFKEESPIEYYNQLMSIESLSSVKARFYFI